MTTTLASCALRRSVLAGVLALLAGPLWAGCFGRMAIPPVVSSEGVTVRLQAPTATRVSVVGEFNHWDPQRDPLVGPSTRGIWTVTIRPPGRPVRYRFLVNEDYLLRDPNELATAPDPYDGTDSSLALSPPPFSPIAAPQGEEITPEALISAIASDPRPLPETKAALLNIATAAAGLPPRSILSMVHTVLLWGMEPRVLSVLIEPVATAHRQGSPVSLAVEAIEEGILKKVPPVTIQSAVRESLEAARTAQGVVDEAIRDGLKMDTRLSPGAAIEHMAHLLRRGTPLNVLTALTHMAVEAAAKRTMSVATLDQTLTALDRFRDVGMPFYLSLRVLEPAIGQGYAAEQYLVIEEAVVRAKRRRVTLEEIAGALETGIGAGRDLETIKRSVDRLAPGSRGGMGSRFF